MRAVCNTSPLILLAKIGRLNLLSELYDNIIIPSAVFDEIIAKPEKDAEQVQLFIQNQIFLLQQASTQSVEDVPVDLGAGEREVIALAIEAEADLVILDDQQGRLIARERGFAVTGTIGVLIEA